MWGLRIFIAVPTGGAFFALAKKTETVQLSKEFICFSVTCFFYALLRELWFFQAAVKRMKYTTFLVSLLALFLCSSFQEKKDQVFFGVETLVPSIFIETIPEGQSASYTLFVIDAESDGVNSGEYTVSVENEDQLFVEVEKMKDWLLQKVGSSVDKYVFRGYLVGGAFAMPFLENYWQDVFQNENEELSQMFFTQPSFASFRSTFPVMQGWGDTEDSQPKTEKAAPFFNLPLTSGDKQNIRKLITSMADKSYVQLFVEKKALEKLGDKIRPIYPLRFIGFVLEDPYLRRCLQTISRDSLKWGPFIKGFEENMRKEEKGKGFTLYVPGFVELLNAKKSDVESFIENQDYSGLVKFFLVD